MTKQKEKLGKPNLKRQQKAVKRRYAWAVTNMLKQVCNVEVVIDGIITSVKEQLTRTVSRGNTLHM